MTDNELLHIKGLAETAIRNANTAENKSYETEAEVVGVATVADEANAQALFTALMTDTLLEEEEEE